MAKDNNICPYITGGKFASYDEKLDKDDKKVAASQSPSSVDCRSERCELWDHTRSMCSFRAHNEAATAYYESA